MPSPILRLLLLSVALSSLDTFAAPALANVGEKGPTIVRFKENPIIRPEMLPGEDGANICGPSLIRAPAWLKNPLGKYYLYFADHKGSYVRLAYADKVEGPWKIHEPGTLHLD